MQPVPPYTPERIRWLPDPGLLDFAKKVKRKTEHNQLWCPIRKKWIPSDPEEWVRQLWIQFLSEKSNIGLGRVAVEKSHLLATGRRYDLVIFDAHASPFLLGEFKAPSVSFSVNHLHQLGDYNSDLNCRFILWSNGLGSWIFDVEREEFIGQIEECLHQYL